MCKASAVAAEDYAGQLYFKCGGCAQWYHNEACPIEGCKRVWVGPTKPGEGWKGPKDSFSVPGRPHWFWDALEWVYDLLHDHVYLRWRGITTAVVWAVPVLFLTMPFWADFSGEHIGNNKIPITPWGPLWAVGTIALALCAGVVMGWLEKDQ